MHIPDVCFDIPQMFIGFGLLDKRGFIRLYAFQALIREKCIASPAHRLEYMILTELMDQIDVCTHQIPAARHLLDDEIAVMQNKF